MPPPTLRQDLTFIVELVAVPGKDDEILEVTGGGTD